MKSTTQVVLTGNALSTALMVSRCHPQLVGACAVPERRRAQHEYQTLLMAQHDAVTEWNQNQIESPDISVEERTRVISHRQRYYGLGAWCMETH